MAKKRSKKKVFIVTGVILAIFIAIIAFVSMNSKSKAVEVSTTKVEKRTITQTVSAIGKIEAETEIKISSETSGEIEFLGVKEGDTVRRSTLLSKIKPDIFQSQLEQYRAAVEASQTEIDIRKTDRENARLELQRASELMNKDFLSKQEYDRIKVAYDNAEAAYRASLARFSQTRASLKEVQSAASRTTIYAPIDGIVTKLDVEIGEKVVGTAQMQGTEMMRISDLSVMNAVVEVDENDIVMVKVGDTARVEIDAIPDKKYNGVVVEIGHSALVNQLGTQDQVTNFKVKVRIVDKEPRLRPGMSCNVDIETETRANTLAVPLQSVTIREVKAGPEMNQEQSGGVERVVDEKQVKTERPPSVVFVRKGQTAKMVTVKTGISDKGYIEIIEGLKEGDEVISGSYMAISKELQNGTQIVLDSSSKKRKPGPKPAGS